MRSSTCAIEVFPRVTSNFWTRTLKNLEPEKPGLRHTLIQKNLDPEKPGPRKTWTKKNLDPETSGL